MIMKHFSPENRIWIENDQILQQKMPKFTL